MKFTKAIITVLCFSVLGLSYTTNAEEKKKKSKNRLRRTLLTDRTEVKPEDFMLDELLVELPDLDDLSESQSNETETRSLSTASRSFGNQDIVIYPGIWGGWKPMEKSDKRGYYACGANLRFEDPIGSGDDTAANGLKLKFCGLNDWYNQEEKLIWNGIWGGWKGWEMCPYGKYIGAANVRFEDRQGSGDDTALNGLAIWCVDKDWNYGEMKVVYSGRWGGWKGWKYQVGKLVKGARARFEDRQGSGDDTALNGIQFNIEKPHFAISSATITGEWVPVASGPQGHFNHKIIESTQTTTSQSLTKEEVYGFSKSISAGFKIKVFEVSANVTSTQSVRTAKTMTKSLQVYKGTETTFGCPSSGSPTGYYTMWQFKMSQPSDASGIGFSSATKYIRCTPSYTQPPKCALGSCKDEFCQVCIA